VVQIKRLMERDSCTLEQAQAKVASQMPLEEKRRLTTNYIDNDGSWDATSAQVTFLAMPGIATQLSLPEVKATFTITNY